MENKLHKITLTNGTVVLLRDPTMKHQRSASELASVGGEDFNAQKFQDEFLRMLIVSVAKPKSKAKPYENAGVGSLDSVFSFVEYLELNDAFGRIVTPSAEKKAKIEIVLSSSSAQTSES